MHANKQIRDALTAAVTGLVTTGTSVGDKVWAEPTVPALRVLWVGETVPEEIQVAGADGDVESAYGRLTQYDIGVRVAGLDHQDQLDQIRFEIEQAIEADDTLGLTGVKIRLTGAGPVDSDAEDSRGTVLMPISYEVSYRTTATDPGTLIE